MTRHIVVLPEKVANQIAAGEVVERPASIVKEMVENAIDAGAHSILVELEKGGCHFIRITDDGAGIAREDVALVFERHATSKILKLEDIYSAGSFGFRGEAMASISSVARVELLTRRPDDIEGTRAVAQAGGILDISPAGFAPGTQMTVTELFANVPARRKFLKTETTEQSVCLEVITRLALAHPEVRFRVIADKREVFTAPAVKKIYDRLAMVMGQEFTGSCLEVFEQNDKTYLKGFISDPSFTRYNSRSIYLYVNSRFIRDNGITHAVLASYRQIIEPRRYPAAVLFLKLPGEDVDINVHPAKLEVRFRHASEIYDLVSIALTRALATPRTLSGSLAYRITQDKSPYTISGFRQPRIFSHVAEYSGNVYSRTNLQDTTINDLCSGKKSMPDNSSAPIENISCNEKITFADQQYLGQFSGTYLVFGGPHGVMLLDQHAAHERILLERLKISGSHNNISQPLLIPEVISLTPAQIDLFQDVLPFLREIGLDLEIFGRDAVVVKALPASLPQIPPGELIADLADQLGNHQAAPSLGERKEKILASLACRAAIKAHTSLSTTEVAALCRDLETTPFNATCPHGRPISVHFSLYEIEKMFKRK